MTSTLTNIQRAGLRLATAGALGLAFLLTGCSRKERVLDVETPGVDIKVDRDKDSGEVDVEIDRNK